MNQPKESFNEQESLKVIREMISKAKQDLSDQAFYPILWGWIVFIGSIGHFLLLISTSFNRPWLIWTIVVIGIIGSFAKGFTSAKKTGAMNYSGTAVGVIWGVFLINYFLLVPFIANINFMITPIVLLMAGGSLVLSGFVLKFNPFYLGGIISWIAAAIAFLFTPEIQLLASAAAALFGLLVPGYILKNREG